MVKITVDCGKCKETTTDKYPGALVVGQTKNGCFDINLHHLSTCDTVDALFEVLHQLVDESEKLDNPAPDKVKRARRSLLRAAKNIEDMATVED